MTFYAKLPDGSQVRVSLNPGTVLTDQDLKVIQEIKDRLYDHKLKGILDAEIESYEQAGDDRG